MRKRTRKDLIVQPKPKPRPKRSNLQPPLNRPRPRSLVKPPVPPKASPVPSSSLTPEDWDKKAKLWEALADRSLETYLRSKK